MPEPPPVIRTDNFSVSFNLPPAHQRADRRKNSECPRSVMKFRRVQGSYILRGLSYLYGPRPILGGIILSIVGV